MGTPFGKYELISTLAKGGMGETHVAELHAGAGVKKRVVIKKMLKRLLDDEALRDAFVQEARISATLSHGNIAQVFDFGEVDGEYFIALEYVRGRSLAQVVARAAQTGVPLLPPPIAAYVMIELLKGLHYAHTRVNDDGQPLNLVHRDVSPDNVIIGFEGEVKLVDFGVAKANMQGRAETEPGTVKGKYRYLSPEQARAEPLDARSDVFSAGIVLYELLTGRSPFKGQGALLMTEIVRGAIEPPHVHVPALPEPLAKVAMTALQRDRAQRFSTALSMQEELTRWLYRQSADFSSEVVRELMGRLFDDELNALGTPFVPRPQATRLLQRMHLPAMAQRPPLTEPQTATTAGPRVEGDTQQKTLHARRFPLWPFGAAVAAFAVVFAGAMLASHFRDVERAESESLAAAQMRPPPRTAATAQHAVAPVVESPVAPVVEPIAAGPRSRAHALLDEARPLYKTGKDQKDLATLTQARRLLVECIKVDRTFPDCHMLLGATLGLLGDGAAGVREYERFLEIAPNHMKAPQVRQLVDAFKAGQGM